jgi:hypothetical protein
MAPFRIRDLESSPGDKLIEISDNRRVPLKQPR